MYEHPATQANLATLRERGVTVLDPGVGRARLQARVGRRAACPSRADCSPRSRRVVPRRRAAAWDGLRVLVTAGGTREPIDAVRYVGNRSSAAAWASRWPRRPPRSGAEVTVVAANVGAAAPPARALRRRRDRRRAAGRLRGGVRRRRRAADGRRGRRLPPGDAGGRQAQEGRPRRAERRAGADGRRPQRRWPRAAAPGQTLVGFAAEHGDGAVAYGRDKLERKGLDAVVVNDIARADIGFDGARERGDDRHRARRAARRAGRKAEVARAILDVVDALRAAAAPGGGRAVTLTVDGPGRARRGEVAGRVGARAAHRRTPSTARSRSAARCSTTCSSRRSPRATSSSRTCPASARRRSRARSRASLDLQFARIQCTADLLPADVVGTNVFNQREDRFEFRPGPIFANVVLVDEINRASPKTQSGPARVHAGAARHRRRAHARAGAPVPRARHAEPGRVRGHLPAARGAGRPLHGPPVARLPERRAARSRCSRAHESGRPRRRARAGRRPPPTCSPPRTPPRRVHASDALRAYVVALLRPHARRTARVELGASPRAGPDAAARRQGARAAAGPRPRAARRRAGAGRRRARAPHRARARGARRHRRAASSPTRWPRPRRCRWQPCARARAMRRRGPRAPRGSASRCSSCRGRLRRRAALRPGRGVRRAGASRGRLGRGRAPAACACARTRRRAPRASRTSRCRSRSRVTAGALPLPSGVGRGRAAARRRRR